MSQSVQQLDTPERPKKRRQRRATGPKPAFFVVQVLDEQGQPMQFDKKRIKLISVERSGEAVLSIIDSGEYDHVFYLRGQVPAGQTARANKPQ